MNNGYVKMHRSMMEKGYYKDSHYSHLWLHLIFSATYREKEYLFNGQIHCLNPGQFITGRNSISQATGINRSKVDRVLKVFENEHQIEQQMFNKFRIISICNWDKYQNDEPQNEPQVSSKCAASEQQVSTINKEKKDNKDKKNNSGSKNPDPRVKFFIDWYVMLYEKKFKKKYAIPNGGKIGKQVKDILKSGLPWDEIQLRAMLFMLDQDPFLIGTEESSGADYDIGIFLSRMNKYDGIKAKNNSNLTKWLIDEKGEKVI
jgi:hypothetical protein